MYSVQHSRGDDLGRHPAEEAQFVGDVQAACAQGEETVAVVHCVGWAGGAGDTSLGHLCPLRGLGFGQGQVGGNDANRRVFSRGWAAKEEVIEAGGHGCKSIGQLTALRVARAGDDAGSVGVYNITDGVDGYQRGYNRATGQCYQCLAQSAPAGVGKTEQFAHSAAGPRADGAPAVVAGCGGLTAEPLKPKS